MRRIVFAAALVGCGSASTPAAAPTEVPSPIVAATVPTALAPEATRGPRHVALRFDLNGRPFPLPLVHGTIAGEPVWMLVDTGSTSHVIARWVARKAGLPLRPLGNVGSDHTGRPIMTYV